MAPKKRASMLQQGQQNFNSVTPQPEQSGAMDVILEDMAIDVFEDDIDNEPDSPSNPCNSTGSKKAKKKVGKKGKSKNKKIGATAASPTPQSLGTIPGPAFGSESRGSLLQPSGWMTTPIPKTRLSLLATSSKFDSGGSSSATNKRDSQLVTSQYPSKKRGSQLITSAKRGSTLVKSWKQRSGSLLPGKQRSGSLLVKRSIKGLKSTEGDNANSGNATAAPGVEMKRAQSVAQFSAPTDDPTDKPIGGKKTSTLGKKLSKMPTMGDLDGTKLSKLGKPKLTRGATQPMPDIQTVEEMENLEGEEKITALQKWKSKAKHLIKVRKSKSRLFAEASKTIQPLAESDAKDGDGFSTELSEPVEGKKRHDLRRASDARHSLFARRKSASARDLGEHRESNLAFSINLPGAARRGSRLSINLRRGSLMNSDARRKSWFDPKNLGFISEKSDQPAAESSESESESSNSEEWSGSSLSDDSSSSEEELDGEEKDEKTKANDEYWKTAKTLLKHTTSDERTDEDVAFILTALRMRFDFFKNLAIDIAKKACIYAEYQKFDEGDELMEQGEDPEALYVIVSGAIGIYSQTILGEGCDNERQLRAVQRAGGVIGEWGLVRGEPATATCVANTRRVATISISAEAYQEHIAAHRADKVKGMAVSMILRTVKPFERSKQDINVVVDYMTTRPIFKDVEREKLEDIGQQVDWLSITNVQPGQPHVIWNEGEKADSVLFIFKGSVSLYRTRKTKGDESTVLVSTLKEGGIVGEWSVAMGLDRVVKVVADSPCDFLVIPRAPYMRHMAAHRSDFVLFEAALNVLRCEQGQQNRHRSQIDMHILQKLMEGLSVFHALDSTTRRLIVQKVDYRLAPKGTVLCKEGDNADACYIILAGKVSIHRYPQSKEARLRKAVNDLQKSIDELKVDEAWIDWQDRCPIRHYWSQRRRAVLDMFLTFEASTCDQKINHWLAGQRKQVEDFAQVKVLHEVARTSARRAISEPAFTAWHSAELAKFCWRKGQDYEKIRRRQQSHMSSNREKLVAIEGLHKDLLNLQTAHQHKFSLDLSDTFPEMDIPQERYFDDDILMLNRPIATVKMSRPTIKTPAKATGIKMARRGSIDRSRQKLQAKLHSPTVAHQKIHLTDVIARRRQMKAKSGYAKFMRRSNSVVGINGGGENQGITDLKQLQRLYGGNPGDSQNLADNTAANTTSNKNLNEKNMLSPRHSPSNSFTIQDALRIGGGSVPDLVDLQEDSKVDQSSAGRDEMRAKLLEGITLSTTLATTRTKENENESGEEDEARTSESSEIGETFGLANTDKRTSLAVKLTRASIQDSTSSCDIAGGRSCFIVGGKRRSLSADAIDKIVEEPILEQTTDVNTDTRTSCALKLTRARASAMARRRSSIAMDGHRPSISGDRSGSFLAMPGVGGQRPSLLPGGISLDPVGGVHRRSVMSASGQRPSFLGPAAPPVQRSSVLAMVGHHRPTVMAPSSPTHCPLLVPGGVQQPELGQSRPQLVIDPSIDEVVYDMSIIPWPTRAARLPIPNSIVDYYPKADASDPLGDQLTTKTKGAVFGELALIRDDKRTASVRTMEETEMLVITKEVYQSLCHKSMSESEEISQAVDALRLASKTRTGQDIASIDRVLNKNRFFQTVPEKARMELCKVSSLIEVQSNVDLFQEGDAPDACYVLLIGMCSLSLSKRTMFTGGAHEDEVSRRSLVSEQEEKKTVSQQVAMFQSGAVFGEWGLMQDTPRSATVTSLSKCVLMVITRDAYRSVLADYRRRCWRIDRCILVLQSSAAQRSAKDMEVVVDNLLQAESLSVAKDVKAAFCEVASYRFVERECNVYPQGVEPDGFYYLIRGSVRVSWDLKDEVAQRHRASRTSIKSMQGALGSTSGRGSHSHGRGRGSAGIAAMMKQMGYRGSKSFSRQQSFAVVDYDPFATSSARGSQISMLEEVDDENLPKIEQSLRARLTRLVNEKAARKSKRKTSNVLKKMNQNLDQESDEDADEISFGDEFRDFMTKILPDVEEMANCGSLEYSKLDSAQQKQRESIDRKSVLIKEVNIDGPALQDAQDKADKDKTDDELTEDRKERDGESSMSPASSKKKQSVVEEESANPASPNASSGNRVTLVGTKEHKTEDEEVLGESDYATLIAKAKVFNTKLKHWSRLGSKRQQYSENLHVPDHAELGLIVAGEIFGYQDVVDECMRPVSVDAIDDCDLLFVPSSHVKRILKQQTTIGLRGAIVDILLAHLPHYEHQRYLLEKLVVYFQIETRSRGVVLTKQGNQDEQLIVVHNGAVRLERKVEGVQFSRSAGLLGAGQVVNDASVILNQSEPFTATVDSATATVFMMSKTDVQSRFPAQFFEEFTELCAQRQAARVEAAEKDLPALPAFPMPKVVPLFQSPFLRKPMFMANDCTAAKILSLFKHWKPPDTLGIASDPVLRQLHRADFKGLKFLPVALSELHNYHLQFGLPHGLSPTPDIDESTNQAAGLSTFMSQVDKDIFNSLGYDTYSDSYNNSYSLEAEFQNRKHKAFADSIIEVGNVKADGLLPALPGAAQMPATSSNQNPNFPKKPQGEKKSGGPRRKRERSLRSVHGKHDIIEFQSQRDADVGINMVEQNIDKYSSEKKEKKVDPNIAFAAMLREHKEIVGHKTDKVDVLVHVSGRELELGHGLTHQDREVLKAIAAQKESSKQHHFTVLTQEKNEKKVHSIALRRQLAMQAAKRRGITIDDVVGFEDDDVKKTRGVNNVKQTLLSIDNEKKIHSAKNAIRNRAHAAATKDGQNTGFNSHRQRQGSMWEGTTSSSRGDSLFAPNDPRGIIAPSIIGSRIASRIVSRMASPDPDDVPASPLPSAGASALLQRVEESMQQQVMTENTTVNWDNFNVDHMLEDSDTTTSPNLAATMESAGTYGVVRTTNQPLCMRRLVPQPGPAHQTAYVRKVPTRPTHRPGPRYLTDWKPGRKKRQLNLYDSENDEDVSREDSVSGSDHGDSSRNTPKMGAPDNQGGVVVRQRRVSFSNPGPAPAAKKRSFDSDDTDDSAKEEKDGRSSVTPDPFGAPQNDEQARNSRHMHAQFPDETLDKLVHIYQREIELGDVYIDKMFVNTRRIVSSQRETREQVTFDAAVLGNGLNKWLSGKREPHLPAVTRGRPSGPKLR